MNPNPAEAFSRILAVLEPPEDMLLADWAEANIVIPQGQSARPGPTRCWPYLVEPLNAIGDRSIERVTVQKSVRVGMTKCLIFAIAARAATDPCPIIFLAPRDEDARGMAVDEIEPIFRESPALKGLLRLGRGDGRNTLTRKSLAGGGSIKILSAMAPSNLRRHDCALLCADEVDAYKVTPEGDALALAERRTMAQPHPKIVCCSTPTDEDTSVITQRYSEGSQEIFEVPCPKCGAFNEIEWSHMEWENHDPETVKYLCPHCKELIPERLKPTMVEGGRWRALKKRAREPSPASLVAKSGCNVPRGEAWRPFRLKGISKYDSRASMADDDKPRRCKHFGRSGRAMGAGDAAPRRDYSGPGDADHLRGRYAR